MKKAAIVFIISIALMFSGCFGKNGNDTIEKGVTVVSSGDRTIVLANSEVWGAAIELNKEIKESDIITEVDKMKIVRIIDGKTLVDIVDIDGGIAAGDKIFEIKSKDTEIKAKLKDALKYNEFDAKMVKELNEVEKKGVRTSNTDVLLGDFDSNNKVDLLDFQEFKNSYGVYNLKYDIAPATKGTTDKFNGIYSKSAPDGVMDLFDFLIFAKNYGKSITEDPTITQINITGPSAVDVGSTISLYASIVYSNGEILTKVVNWSSSDTTVASLISNGEWSAVTGVKDGTVVIKAELDGKIASYPVTVNAISGKVVSSVEISGGNSVTIGGALQLTANAEFNDNTTGTLAGGIWSSSNNTVATVDQTGKVIGVSAGTTKIKVEKSGVTHEVTVVVSALVNGVKVHTKGYAKIYAWEGSNTELCGAWPGSALKTDGETTGWGYWYFEGKTSVNMIFIDASSNNTGDLKGITSGEHWYVNGKWTDTNPDVDFTAPVITSNPAAGNIEGSSVNVSLTAADNSDTAPKIYYTDDNTTPTINSKLYSSSLTLTNDGIIKAISTDKNGNVSKIYVFSYKLNQDATKPVISISPAAGSYTTGQTAKITVTDNKDTSPSVYYTIDGTEPEEKLAHMYNGQAINVDKSMTIKVLAVDKSGNKSNGAFSYYIGTNTVKYNDFREETIYFMMTDRFADGDTTNNDIWGDEYLPNGEADMYKYDESKTGILTYYHGGDFAGIIKNLDYLKEMGFTAIWITPAAKQPEGRYYWTGTGDPYQASAFHGYWAYDFDQIDPHLHTERDEKGKWLDGWNDFQKLADAIHAKGMKLMLDVVINHGHPGDAAANTKWKKDELNIIMDKKTWKYDSATDPYGSTTVSTTPYVRNGFFNYGGDYKLSSLLDFNERGESGKDAREHLKNVFRKYIDHGVDAMRIDTAAYVTNEWMGEFADAMANYAKTKGNDHFYLMSEGWCGRYDAIQRAAYDKTGALHMIDMQASCLDFPGQMSNVFKPGGDYALFKNFTSSDKSSGLDDATFVGMFVDNHDCFRANGIFDETQYKNALNYIYFFRGIPIVYYGTEAMYSWDGAHASTNKEDVVARWMLGQKGIDYVKTNKPPMYKHIKMLNEIRKKCEGVQKGQQSEIVLSGDKAVLKRDYGDKSAYVAISKGAAYSYTFDSIPAGTYLKITMDAATASYTEQTITVSGSASVDVKANSVVVLQKQ